MTWGEGERGRVMTDTPGENVNDGGGQSYDGLLVELWLGGRIMIFKG